MLDVTCHGYYSDYIDNAPGSNMTTIIAKIPARTIRGFANGKTRTIPAMVRQFERDERGCWEAIDGAVRFGCLESDVIDTCSKATNWADIRREHFPMHGFHA